MRVGLFGGSFDPPHVGHLLVAQDARSALALDLLLVIPSAQQPLKDAHGSAAAHRFAMVEACFGGLPGILVDPVEIDRGGLSYMVDTVQDVRRRWPTADLHLLIGADVVPTLPRWHDIDRLLGEVRLVVLTRDADPVPTAGPLHVHGGVEAIRLSTRRVDVTSTEIRARVRDGHSLRGFVPDTVAHYIASTGLYLC